MRDILGLFGTFGGVCGCRAGWSGLEALHGEGVQFLLFSLLTELRSTLGTSPVGRVGVGCRGVREPKLRDILGHFGTLLGVWV